MAQVPKLTVILSELDTLIKPQEERRVLDFACQAEAAGYYGVHIIDHIVMGPGSACNGLPPNPRAFRWVGNQAPDQHMPSQIVMMSAIAAVTSELRLMATATLTPLRHPLLNAKNWATLDLISEGRLTITPIGGWQHEEYEAMGIDFKERGRRLDEQLAIMRLAWTETPISYRGEFYQFDDISVVPKPVQTGGPELLIGGDRLSKKVVERIVKYGSGYTLAGEPESDGLALLASEMNKAGRDINNLKTSGLVVPHFPVDDQCADLALSLEQCLPPLLAAGVDAITIKPSQYIDDPEQMPTFLKQCRERVESMCQ
ncbi:MAG: LLM class flavin-dependent oxidoreductase [Halieaceae bacterium]|nr:LLM class flavin-dependent oxidoreductase [Halieaceae bacterium]